MAGLTESIGASSIWSVAPFFRGGVGAGSAVPPALTGPAIWLGVVVGALGTLLAVGTLLVGAGGGTELLFFGGGFGAGSGVDAGARADFGGGRGRFEGGGVTASPRIVGGPDPIAGVEFT